jgi:hypothetical protein
MTQRGEMENQVKRYKPKRRVVERSGSWLNQFRKLLTKWEDKAENYLGLAPASVLHRSPPANNLGIGS